MFTLHSTKPVLNRDSFFSTEHIENYGTYQDAIKDILDHWNEDDVGITFIVRDEWGNVPVTLIKPQVNSDEAIVIYMDGKVEKFTCTYQTINGRTETLVKQVPVHCFD